MLEIVKVRMEVKKVSCPLASFLDQEIETVSNKTKGSTVQVKVTVFPMEVTISIGSMTTSNSRGEITIRFCSTFWEHFKTYLVHLVKLWKQLEEQMLRWEMEYNLPRPNF